MSTPNKYTPTANVQPPRCPHCSADLPEVSTYQWTKQIAQGEGVVITLAIYCPNSECRKLMGTQMLIVQHAEEQGVIRPPH